MAKLEKVDTNKIKLIFDINKEKIEEGTRYAYNKNRAKFNIPGFRKGKAPRKIIEAQFGKGVFFEDALNYCIPDAYQEAIKEHELDLVSRPEFDIEEISEDGTVTVIAEVYVKPVIDPVDYKGVKYPKKELIVSDEEINNKIEDDRNLNSRMVMVEDRPVQDKDSVLIDFIGYIDGVPFEGGEGSDYELTIGSGTFIGDFEQQLIGHSLDEKVTVNVAFPEEYHQEALQNKPATFEVTIKEIRYKELPELDDDFVQDISDFMTLDQYKSDISAKIMEQKREDYRYEKENAIMEKIVEANAFEIPDVMIEDHINTLVRQFSDRITSQGISFDMYLEYIGKTNEELREDYRAQAFNQVKGSLILGAIAEKENIEISEEEADSKIAEIAEQNKIDIDKLKAAMDGNNKKQLIDDLKLQKAFEFVIDSAIEE